ncbi:MAG TPA: Clp protease N-terminal domain-containing protein [Ktedonobacterales bacterium]|nr:Clp protease N-terminal domain-containing protein [Ktedonobacterales bacterium]
MFGHSDIGGFDKFTEKARKAMERAAEEAKSHNHKFVGTEHLLLGLTDVEDGVAARALNTLTSLEKVRGAIEHIIGTGDHIIADGPGLTRRAKKVLELAVEEAKSFKHRYIGTEHVLLGLIREGDGIAAQVLASLGVSLQSARACVLVLLSQVARDAQPAGARSNVITCRLDDRDLDALDALVEAGIRTTRSDAASWLIRAGIEAHRPLFERVYATVGEIRQLRAEAQKIAQEVTGEAAPDEPLAGEQEPPAEASL